MDKGVQGLGGFFEWMRKAKSYFMGKNTAGEGPGLAEAGSSGTEARTSGMKARIACNANNRVNELALLFKKYKTYPAGCYHENTPVRQFQKMFPSDHYSRDLDVFLGKQDYEPEHRGADLPWWGKKYFLERKGFRVVIVGQDSLTRDAGGVVFSNHLMPWVNGRNDYEEHTTGFEPEYVMKFSSWNKIKIQLQEWKLDWDLLYVTNARKVYKEGSWDSFDTQGSKALLEEELELCRPDLVILLGAQPLKVLNSSLVYSSVIKNKKPVFIKGRQCLIVPFPGTQPRINGSQPRIINVGNVIAKMKQEKEQKQVEKAAVSRETLPGGQPSGLPVTDCGCEVLSADKMSS